MPERGEPGPAIAAIVLAAGRSTRMGDKNKLLLELEPGIPVVRRVVENIMAAGIDTILVVTGHEGADVERALAGFGCVFLQNSRFTDGMAGSLKIGFERAVSDGAAGVLVFLGDMPFVERGDIATVLEAVGSDPGRSVLPLVGSKPGHPVWLPARLGAAVGRLTGDRGARKLIEESGERAVTVALSNRAAIDLDTPQAFAAAMEKHEE
jgi:molybdenum cofactor cytidylyltransferase